MPLNTGDDTHNQPFKFWLPPLALFTGCRLEEMCQLQCDDIKQIDGIWVIDIDAGNDKHVKNRTSRRMIPLHPVLVDELKFPEFVAQPALILSVPAMSPRQIARERRCRT